MTLDGTFSRDDRPRGHPGKRRFWLTPPDMMAKLEAEWAFNFDACPHPRPEGFDGLRVPWGTSTWVNPPFTGISWTKWARKAIAENAQGKTVVFVMPIYAGRAVTVLCKANAEWRMLGLVRWVAIEDGTPSDLTNSPPVLLAILRGRSHG